MKSEGEKKMRMRKKKIKEKSVLLNTTLGSLGGGGEQYIWVPTSHSWRYTCTHAVHLGALSIM